MLGKTNLIHKDANYSLELIVPCCMVSGVSVSLSSWQLPFLLSYEGLCDCLGFCFLISQFEVVGCQKQDLHFSWW